MTNRGCSNHLKFVLNKNVVILTGAIITLISFTEGCSRHHDQLSQLVTRPASAYDIKLNDVSNYGCLDLTKFKLALDSLPPDTSIRTYSHNFEFEPSTHISKQVRPNFSVVAARGHFEFSENLLSTKTAKWLQIAQNGCSTVTVFDALNNERTYIVEHSDDTSTVALSEHNGQHIVYQLNNKRELTIQTRSTIMDFCPPYEKFVTTSKQSIHWGPKDYLEKTPITLSRSFLGKVMGAVNNSPPELINLLLTSNSSVVSVSPAVLAELSSLSLNENQQLCPKVSTPPQGDEAPAPQNL
jgi:hypothetical protein